MNMLFRASCISTHKNSRRNLAENLFGSGSGSGHFQKSDPDPVKIVRIRNTDYCTFFKEKIFITSPFFSRKHRTNTKTKNSYFFIPFGNRSSNFCFRTIFFCFIRSSKDPHHFTGVRAVAASI
jgi:hypothetical protein